MGKKSKLETAFYSPETVGKEFGRLIPDSHRRKKETRKKEMCDWEICQADLPNQEIPGFLHPTQLNPNP